jgi:hypothetical protein
MRRVATARLLVLASVAWLAGAPGAVPPDRLASLPRVLLWAWERPEDLRFAPRLGVGVAALDRTLTLRGADVVVTPRRQRLLVASETPIVAVVRIEADARAAREADPTRVAELIVAAGARPGCRALQIDFDATASQRALYRRIVHEVRRRLPDGLPLSITALASWCAGDRWLDELPIDEAVPMFFEMGPDRVVIAERLRQDAPFSDGRCAVAIGVSTREPLGRVPRAARAYVFSYAPWTFETAAAAVRGVDR